jgi:hypothetical protein
MDGQVGRQRRSMKLKATPSPAVGRARDQDLCSGNGTHAGNKAPVCQLPTPVIGQVVGSKTQPTLNQNRMDGPQRRRKISGTQRTTT